MQFRRILSCNNFRRIYCALYHFTISERSNLFYKHMEPTRALFYKMDKSKIGLISYQDFYPIVREDSKHLGWLFKAKAMIEEDL